MSQPTNHEKTIALPHCWICGERFVEFGGTAVLEHHHVIPQAFGGTDGPTVSICDSHHTKLHSIAVQMKTSKPYTSFLQGETSERAKKVLYLAQAVYNAQQVTRDDPNKLASTMVKLNARHKRQLDQLKAVYPKLKSRDAILLHALEFLHSRHFMK